MTLRTLDEVLSTDLQNDLHDPDFVRLYLAASWKEAQTNNDNGIYDLAVEDVKKANPFTYSALLDAAGSGSGFTLDLPTSKEREIAGL